MTWAPKIRALVVLIGAMLTNEVAATWDGLHKRLRFFRWLED